MDIKYTKQVHFIGRNGYFKQSGLVVQAHEGEMVVIMPLTSRGVTGNCMLDIPLEDVPSVIDALQKSAKLPTHGLVKTLTDTELCIIFEAARTALADGEVFDSLGEKMDLNDGVMKEIQEKLEGIMNPLPHKTSAPCPYCGRNEDGKWFNPCPSDDCPSLAMKPLPEPIPA